MGGGRIPWIAAVTCLILAPPARAQRAPAGQIQVTGWVGTTFDYQNSFRSFYEHADRFAEVMPFWFHAMPDGSVEPLVPGPNDRTSKRLEQVESLFKAVCAEHRVALLPCIAGPEDPEHRGVSTSLIHDSTRRTAHVRAIVELVRSHGYDGIDIDYEGFPGSDRADFTAFITELATALHAEGKLLSAAVGAKTADDDGDDSQDWQALGLVLDRIRIMAYDEHEDGGDPGPIASLEWFRKVVAYAVTRVAPAKIEMGIPVYGYDWEKPGDSEEVPAREGPQWARSVQAVPTYDPVTGGTWFTYPRDGITHHVWYEDARPLPEKLKVLLAAGVDGIAVWHFGEETPEFWEAVGPGVIPPKAP